MPNGQSESVNRRRTDNTMAKKKGQKDKQRSTKYTYKTKDRVTRTSLKTGGEQYSTTLEKNLQQQQKKTKSPTRWQFIRIGQH